jgi:hypothetical protein
VSEDGSNAHVVVRAVLDGPAVIRRVQLPTLQTQIEFSAGGFPGDIVAVPGAPTSVAVETNVFPFTRVAVYDDGVQRPAFLSDQNQNPTVLAFGRGGTLYGYNDHDTGHELTTMAVGPGGVSRVRVQRDLINGFTARIVFAGGRVYSSPGHVVDPELNRRLGRLGTGGTAIAVDASLGRAFVVGNGTLTAYDLNTFQVLGSVIVSSAVNESQSAFGRGRLLRWGIDGLAFRDLNRVYVFRTGLAAR